MIRICLVIFAALITASFLVFRHSHQSANLMSPTTKLAEWQWTQAPTTSGGVTLDEGGLKCDIRAVDGAASHLALFHRGIVVESGHRYRVAFSAKADKVMKLYVTGDQGNYGGSSANIGLDTYFLLDQQWHKQEATFTPVGKAGHAVSLPAFGFADTTGIVWLKDIVVEQLN